jgi:hypothetical protein
MPQSMLLALRLVILASRLGSRSARARAGGDDLGGADMAKQIGAARKDQVAWRKGREMVLVILDPAQRTLW